jgi:quercetin dioxygenase-like cupin family protein
VEPAPRTPPPGRAVHLPAGGGETVWFGEAVYSFKATRRATGGLFTLAEASVPPGNGPPAHRHNAVDESFYILSGAFEFLSGDDWFPAGAGDFVYVPRGVRHRFLNAGAHVARMLFMFTPGAMDEYFAEIGRPAVPGQAPPPLTADQRRLIAELAPRHGLVLDPGPPPAAAPDRPPAP